MRRAFKTITTLKCMMLITAFILFTQSVCFAIGGHGVISDSTLPVINLLGSASVNHEAGTVYNDEGATAIDNVDGDITDYIVVYSLVDENVPGEYTIKYSVEDTAGNKAEDVIRTVTVVDAGWPVITLVGDTMVSHAQGSAYVDAGATAVDSIDGDLTGDIVVNNPVDVNTLGTYTITYNVEDSSGNAAVTVTRTVSVEGATTPVVTDSDGDGYADAEDAFPSDPEEWVDTDGDGIGNNGDTDDDNDSLPDTWEIEYGLNPLVNDAMDDADNDGISNFDEYSSGSDPTVPSAAVPENQAPDTPEPYLPVYDAVNVSLQAELMMLGFSDPDTGDWHAKTRWQISTDAAFTSLALDRESSECLVSMVIPKFVLNKNTEYFWRVKFLDNHGAESEWSESYSFITANNYSNDANGNGIPDDQEVDSTSDLDRDGTPDIIQYNIKSLKNKGTQTQMAITEITNGGVLECAEMVNMDNVIDGSVGIIPFGFVGFKILTQNPGDALNVKICFSKKLNPQSVWYKYDAMTGMKDYSDHTFISDDRLSLVLELKDGGYGDADGTKNGVIVDPGGIFEPIASVSEEGEAEIDVVKLTESVTEEMTKNCFITTAGDASNRMMLVMLLIMGMFAIGRMVLVKRTK